MFFVVLLCFCVFLLFSCLRFCCCCCLLLFDVLCLFVFVFSEGKVTPCATGPPPERPRIDYQKLEFSNTAGKLFPGTSHRDHERTTQLNGEVFNGTGATQWGSLQWRRCLPYVLGSGAFPEKCVEIKEVNDGRFPCGGRRGDLRKHWRELHVLPYMESKWPFFVCFFCFYLFFICCFCFFLFCF